jgi:hypothetical protein
MYSGILTMLPTKRNLLVFTTLMTPAASRARTPSHAQNCIATTQFSFIGPHIVRSISLSKSSSWFSSFLVNTHVSTAIHWDVPTANFCATHRNIFLPGFWILKRKYSNKHFFSHDFFPHSHLTQIF